jgi:hypothetical protein
MAETLLEEVNPNGNIQAVVESDDDACYFYLFPAPDTQFGMKSVWVRNHTRAPETLDVERMQSGSPPRNPARHCRDTEGRPAPVPPDSCRSFRIGEIFRPVPTTPVSRKRLPRRLELVEACFCHR